MLQYRPTYQILSMSSGHPLTLVGQVESGANCIPHLAPLLFGEHIVTPQWNNSSILSNWKTCKRIAVRTSFS
jgi:hypothetical protein